MPGKGKGRNKKMATLSVSSPVAPGGHVDVVFSGFIDYVYVSIGVFGYGEITGGYANENGGGAWGFDIPLTQSGNYTMYATDGLSSAMASFDIAGVQIPPSLSIVSQQPVPQNSVMLFTFANFDKNAQVSVGIVGGSSGVFVADGQGNSPSPYSLSVGALTPGLHRLMANDDYNMAELYFDVAGPAVNEALVITNPEVVQGNVLAFYLTGYLPYTNVFVYVVQTGGGITVQTDSLGGVTGSFTTNDPPGDYTLKADLASASFTVKPRVGSWTVLTEVSSTLNANHVWEVLNDLTANINSSAWQILNNLTANINSSAWQILNNLTANINSSAWQIINSLNTSLLSSSWIVINNIESLLGATQWVALNNIAANISPDNGEEPPPDEGGTNWLPAIIVGGAALAALAVAGAKSKKTPKKA
jgi:hypothetical protein